MTTMLIANNCTRENGGFMGDQLCSLKTAYLFVENTPGVDRVLMSMSPHNEMNFVWQKFIDTHKVEVIWDDWNPGDWDARHTAWDMWRVGRHINGIHFDHYRELYLRIHGAQRQNLICGSERGLNRRNIYQYWYCGQENCPDELLPEVDWFDDTLCYHPEHKPTRDVYIAPHCKTQGNYVFTFEYWADVVRRLLDNGLTVTVGYDGWFWDETFNTHPNYKKYWGTHEQWFDEVCGHRVVACGNTGTGWVAAACGVPMVTMEPPNSQMPDHRYRQCGLRNIVDLLSEPDSTHCARVLTDFVRRKVVMTTGCYDVLHAGHVRHLERARALGTKLIVALNSDSSVKQLKGPTRPINPVNQRKTVLEALRCVDEVRVFDGTDALPLIEEIRPDVLACGFGYTSATVVGREVVESYGGKVVITCEGDASNEPSTTKTVQRILRSGDVEEVCRLASAYSVNPPEKLRLLAYEFLSVLREGIPGDVADLGTCQGGTALVLRKLAPERHLHCFDTWEGNPHDDPLCHHRRGSWAARLEDCKSVVGTDELTHYQQGVFPNNVTCNGQLRAGIKPFCFVYVDMDTYQSTVDAIGFFWPNLSIGGKLVIDDYGWEPCAGVKKAVDEVFSADVLSENRVVESLHTVVITKKAGD